MSHADQWARASGDGIIIRELTSERDALIAEVDRLRGRPETGIAGPRDYEFAETIFHGWQQRARRAELSLRRVKDSSRAWALLLSSLQHEIVEVLSRPEIPDG